MVLRCLLSVWFNQCSTLIYLFTTDAKYSQTLTASLKNDTSPVITRSTFGRNTKDFPLLINCLQLKLNNVRTFSVQIHYITLHYITLHYITYVTFDTNLLQNVFVCQLPLRHVSASVTGHLQGARDFLGGCNLRVNVCGRDSTNKLCYK
jgi:hypothetical protein